MDTSTQASEEEDLVFEHLSEPVESVQHYVMGGLHPTYLGDMVGNGRYKILRKLGYGGYSTVWLAQDFSKNNSLVALKIVRADHDCANEVRCYDMLQANQEQHPSQSCIMMLKDHFTITGPNGRHTCLVYEVMGPSIASVLVESFGFDTEPYLTLSCARRVIYQVLIGLDRMHSIGLVHGDIYAANVLFALRDLSQESIDGLKQAPEDVSVAVERLSGKSMPGDPRHLAQIRPLDQLLSPNGEVKLADLGNSFLEGSPPDQVEMPPEIRSPEIIFDNNISQAHDSWAFGCFIYYVLTNRELFELAFIYDKDARDDVHLLQLFSILGQIPTKLKQSWPRYNRYFDEAGEMTCFNVNDDFFSNIGPGDFSEEDSCSTTSVSPHIRRDTLPEQADARFSALSSDQARTEDRMFKPELYPSIIKMVKRKIREDQEDPKTVAEFATLNPPLRKKWMSERHPDMQLEESELVLDMLEGLLAYDPDQRLSTKKLLRHDWIRRYCAPRDSQGCQSPAEAATTQGYKRKRSVTDSQEDMISGLSEKV